MITAALRQPVTQSRPFALPLSEQDIQRTVFRHLKTRGAPGVFAFHVPNGGKRRPIEAAIFKGIGVRAGITDVICIHEGRIFALELKTEKGKATPEQLETMKAMAVAGATVGIAFGLDEALAWLEREGLLRGTAA